MSKEAFVTKGKAGICYISETKTVEKKDYLKMPSNSKSDLLLIQLHRVLLNQQQKVSIRTVTHLVTLIHSESTLAV